MTQLNQSYLPIVFYHANCADGFGAAFAAWKQFGNGGAIYVPVQHNNYVYNSETGLLAIDDTIYQLFNRTIYILDFSFSPSVMASLFNLASTYDLKIVWLDHHKTSFEALGIAYTRGVRYDKVTENLDILLDDSQSGAMIAWHYFVDADTVPTLIAHIDDYDCWQFKIPGTKEFNKFLWSLAPWNFEQWDKLLAVPEAEMNGAYMAGEAILRAHDQNIQSIIAASKREVTLTWFESTPIESPHEDNKSYAVSRQVAASGLAANCPKHLASDVGHNLAVESGTYGLCWFVDSLGNIECSLRSNGDYDVSAMAKAIAGGGGHKNAAGFKLASMEAFNKFFYPNRRTL